MSYYGDSMSYYYGGPFANHSSLMTGTGRIHTPLRFAPHLSTIAESPLSTYRRYSPAVPSVLSSHSKRIIDTADIDVSTPRNLHSNTSRPGNRLRRDRPTIRIRSQALKDNPSLREHNERHEKTVGELLMEKFLIKDKKAEEDSPRSRIYHQVSLESDLDDQPEALQRKVTRRMTRRRSSADIQMDPGQLERELAIAAVQAEVLDELVAEEQAEIEVETRKGTLLHKNPIRSAAIEPSESEEGKSEEAKKKIPKKIKKRKKTTDKPSPPSPPSPAPSEESNRGGKLFKIEASNSVGDFSTLLVNAKENAKICEQFRESIRLPPPKAGRSADPDAIGEEVVVLPIKKPYVHDNTRNSVYLTLKTQIGKPSIGKVEETTGTNKKSLRTKMDDIPSDMASKLANIRSKDIRETEVTSPSDVIQSENAVDLIKETSSAPKTALETVNLSKTSEKFPEISVDTSQKDLKVLENRVVDADVNSHVNVVNLEKNETLPNLTENSQTNVEENAQNFVINRKSEVKKTDEVLNCDVGKYGDASKSGAQGDSVGDNLWDVRGSEKRPPQVVDKTNTDSEQPEVKAKDNSISKTKVTLGKRQVGSPSAKLEIKNRENIFAKFKKSSTESEASSVLKPKVKQKEKTLFNSKSSSTESEVSSVFKPEITPKDISASQSQKSSLDSEAPAVLTPQVKEKDKILPDTQSLPTGGEIAKIPEVEAKSNPEIGELKNTSSGAELPASPKPPTAEGNKLLNKVNSSSTDGEVLIAEVKPKDKMLNKAKLSSADSGIGSMDLDVKTPEKRLKKKVLKNSKGLSFECDEDVKPKLLNELSDSSKNLSEFSDKPKLVKRPKKKITTSKTLPLDIIDKNPPSILLDLNPPEDKKRPQIQKTLSFTKQKPKILLSPKEDEKSEPEVDFWSQIITTAEPKIERPKLSLKTPLTDVIIKEEMKPNTPAIIQEQKTPESLVKKEEEVEKVPEAIFDNSLGSENLHTTKRNFETGEINETNVLLTPTVDIESNVTGIEAEVLKTAPEVAEAIKTIPEVPEEPKTIPEVAETLKTISEAAETLKTISAVAETLKTIPEAAEIPETAKAPAVPLANVGAPSADTEEPIETSDPATPVSEVPAPMLNTGVPLVTVAVPVVPEKDAKCEEEDEDDGPKTPTNEDTSVNLSKWNCSADLPTADGKEVPSSTAEPQNEVVPPVPQVSKKKLGRRKKSATPSSEDTVRRKISGIPEEGSESKPVISKTPNNSPAETEKKTKRPMDLMRVFYTTPSSLLTATPRDLSKVRRAKVKRKKHSPTPSTSSDSTGSTRSSTSRSNSTEVDDDAEQKRISSTRSNDSGFDGSPRLSNCDMACHKKCEKLTGNLCGLNQKLVAEALQALKRAPSQSSDNQRNSDSSDHVHGSGRITPPATNLPRFKKYTVEDFHFLKVLGKGSFGKVLLAELRGTDCVYAVKCLKKDVVLEDDDVECTLIERKVLTLATRHPYLCHLFCTFQTDSHLFFVMEYLNGGDLMFHIQKSGRFAEFRARFYAAEIWSGLNFLHKKGIVYRDLKLDNVLLDFEGHIRIADFGMCKLQIFLDRTADTFCGTPDYMAPEIIKGLKYNQAVDWWSFGVLLYEMLTGQSPFSGCDEDELFWSICNERPFIPRYLSQEAMDMLVSLLEKDAGKRPMGHEIQAHAFFHSLSWDRLERRMLDPPFKPALEHTLDTRYFDTAFTAERPRLTPVPEQILTSMDQGVFRGFSYTNPNATD